jgi:8-oxo-dGTP pyrophosphatase MutT (NUDIX family)
LRSWFGGSAEEPRVVDDVTADDSGTVDGVANSELHESDSDYEDADEYTDADYEDAVDSVEPSPLHAPLSPFSASTPSLPLPSPPPPAAVKSWASVASSSSHPPPPASVAVRRTRSLPAPPPQPVDDAVKCVDTKRRCYNVVYTGDGSPKRTKILIVLERANLRWRTSTSPPKYVDGRCGLPKGHACVNESSGDCTLRELREETGIDLRRPETQHLFASSMTSQNIRYTYVFDEESLEKLRTRESTRNVETDGGRWVSLATILGRRGGSRGDGDPRCAKNGFNQSIEKISLETLRKHLREATSRRLL